MPADPRPPADPRSDEALLSAAGTGHDAAFATLYHRHRDWVARLAHRFTGDRDAALDVLQETFIYLLRKRPGLRLTARLTTFLYPVVKHLAAEARRKRARFAGDDAGADTAVALEIPLGTVKSRLHGAIQVLRRDTRLQAYSRE